MTENTLHLSPITCSCPLKRAVILEEGPLYFYNRYVYIFMFRYIKLRHALEVTLSVLPFSHCKFNFIFLTKTAIP
jgi:hypothetical protein